MSGTEENLYGQEALFTDNMATFANINKSSDPTWKKKIRHGRDTVLQDIEEYTFTDIPFISEETELKDITFSELQDAMWTNPSKNTATWSNEARS